ncbi:hypothetical protein [Shewanella surugensis]|uniref:Uncharacterized protein n=1 Tax=Shewanella surugensis TaxID=212020 RepID=A0ABT0LEE4_9GAMM|nr:hypothetical protein [Shewanella surugensis]MCL1126079.1 hypothetical protein [Shewanella surugensis]
MDPDGEFGIVGALIGAGVEAFAQVLTHQGSYSDFSFNKTDIAIAAVVGAVTGGMGGRLAMQSAKGAMRASDALVTTMSVGSTTNVAGAMLSSKLNGTEFTEKQMIYAAIGGGFGTGVGGKIATNTARTLERGFGSFNASIASSTEKAFVGKTAEASTSVFQQAGAISADLSLNTSQKVLSD